MENLYLITGDDEFTKSEQLDNIKSRVIDLLNIYSLLALRSINNSNENNINNGNNEKEISMPNDANEINGNEE